MPVVVTGASGLVGRHAVPALARRSPEVRAYVRRPEAAAALRALGAKVAVGDIRDTDTLEVVMRGAHTVCHLVGGLAEADPRALEETNLGSVRAVVTAARRARVQRLLFLSYPGASPAAANPYLRAKGRAEDAIRGSGLAHAIIRSTHIYGPGSEWLRFVLLQARAWPALVLGTGRQVAAPVFVRDVAAVLAAADDRALLSSGTWGLEGPDRVTMDGLVDLVTGGRRPKVHLAPRAMARLGRLLGRRVSAAALEVLAADSVADAPDAAAEFGVPLTALRGGLAQSLGGAEDGNRKEDRDGQIRPTGGGGRGGDDPPGPSPGERHRSAGHRGAPGGGRGGNGPG